MGYIIASKISVHTPPILNIMVRIRVRFKNRVRVRNRVKVRVIAVCNGMWG